MKSIFKTGTFLTAENLNLAQRVSGLVGIIEGCEVYNYDKKLLGISKGIAKFDDGDIIQFDGGESIDISNRSTGNYYVVVIKYSSYSLAYDIVSNLPDYPYIKLADVLIGTNTVSISNSNKSSISFDKRVYEYDYLQGYLAEFLAEDEYGIKCFKLKAEDTGSSYVSKKFSIGFIASSEVSKITVKGNLNNNNQISFVLKINGTIYQFPTTANAMSLNSSSSGDVDFILNVPSGYTKKDDKCILEITLFNVAEGSAEATIYNLTIN